MRYIFFLLMMLLPGFSGEAQTPQQMYYMLLSGCDVQDADAASYINRLDSAGKKLTCPEKAKIAAYVDSLKVNGLWADIREQGLMLGGSAATMAVNLKGFSVTTFVNAPTATATGMDWNGTNQYGNTGVKPSDALQNSIHFAYYSGDTSTNNADNTSIMIGARQTTRNKLTVEANAVSNQVIAQVSANSTTNNNVGSVSSATSQGLFIVTRTSSASYSAYRNGVLFGTASIASSAPNTNVFFIGAGANGVNPELYTTRECRGWSVGYGLTQEKVIIFTRLWNDLFKFFNKSTFN